MGVMLSFYNVRIGMMIMVFFLLPNVIGCYLWYHRDRIAPYPAIQWLMVVIGLFTLFTFLAFDLSGWTDQFGESLSGANRKLYLLLLLYPGLMLMFYFQNRSKNR
jgi:hypothetical protein